jgi:hypothetical protein
MMSMDETRETLAQELRRLVGEYNDDDAGDATKEEAWNMIADFVVDNAKAVVAALSAAQPAPVKPTGETATILEGIAFAMESRGYAHMTNGRDIGALLDRLAELEALPTPQPVERPCEPVAPFGIDKDGVEALRANGLKPEEISGDPKLQAERVRELLHWFVRLSRGSANPKWTRDHAFELAYYIATTDDRAPIDTSKIEQDAWLKGVKAPYAERDMMLRIGLITQAELDAATPLSPAQGTVERAEPVVGAVRIPNIDTSISPETQAELDGIDEALRRGSMLAKGIQPPSSIVPVFASPPVDGDAVRALDDERIDAAIREWMSSDDRSADGFRLRMRAAIDAALSAGSQGSGRE